LDDKAIERLARLRGIGDAYHDYRGDLKHFSLGTKVGILRAMGCATDDPAAVDAEIHRIEIARWRSLLPKVAAARGSRIGFDINVTARDFGSSLIWSLVLEDGTLREGVVSTADCPEIWRGEVEGVWVTRRRFELPAALPPGYHELQARVSGGAVQRCLLIVSPPDCYEPPAIVAGGRLWGVAVQLYTLRSAGNWGIGDFADLGAMIRWLAPRGAGFIGLNPLHALAPAEPERASPYSASNRHFLNILYIAVPAVPEFAESVRARQRCAEAAFQERLAGLRAAARVDYAGVAAIKLEILALLHEEFRSRHLAAGTARAAAFQAFVSARGLLLQRQARFDALDAHFRSSLGSNSGWLSWPHEFRDLDGPAVREFCAAHPQAVEFHAYLQWLAHEQLGAAQASARALGMPIGLYGDYAVGANPSGAETWGDPLSYKLGAEIGAPPDPLALKGQGWGIPPQDPLAMQEERLAGFIGLIRDNMRYYGALRLDHVMSLFRLWWVPGGESPQDGAYVHYPLEQLLTVVSLESARNRCLVVGEDLGVVPQEMRTAMPQFGLYAYKVMLFEKQDGRFRAPQDYQRRALATVTTHDMPTLRSFWEGLDIELRERLQLYPGREIPAQVRRERQQDRVDLLEALRAEHLAPGEPSAPGGPFTPELAQAMHLYLSRSAAALAALQLEDLLGMVEPVNVPGTSHEYPNWQRKMSAAVEELAASAELDRRLAAIALARA
jgi:4-alpha-glucanotransferase